MEKVTNNDYATSERFRAFEIPASSDYYKAVDLSDRDTKTIAVIKGVSEASDQTYGKWRTDQGAQYSAKGFRDCLVLHNIAQSMSRRGN